MATPSPPFQLTSNQTALALVVPKHLQEDINTLRRVHDKAFRKWEPHINIIYPFVDTSRLNDAVTLLRNKFQDVTISKLSTSIDEVGNFRHRRNATIFLKPSSASEVALCQLRKVLVEALGCDESAGTHDGTFRPHMTIGQAGFQREAIEKLSEKVQKLIGLNWEAISLAVLQRESSGEMTMVDKLYFGESDEEEPERASGRLQLGWRPCFLFNNDNGWTQKTPEYSLPNGTNPMSVSIATYNIMADSYGPSFTSRFPLIMKAIKSAIPTLDTALQILCLQEVDDESLPLLLSDPFIQNTYPYSTHSPSSILSSKRNVVALASVPFTQFHLHFNERYKSAIIVSFQDHPLILANVHLTSALTDEAVAVKKDQIRVVSEFLAQNSPVMAGKETIIAGDFNLTTSIQTIDTALSRRIIQPETADAVRKVVNLDFWEDAYLASEDNGDEDASGEEGATFDRMTNPLLADIEPPIDRNPQRYDRVLFQKRGDIFVEDFEIFGYPTEEGRCGSDHYGVRTTLRVGTEHNEPNLVAKHEVPSKTIEVIMDMTDLEPLITTHLPSTEDRLQRERALGLLHQTLSGRLESQDLLLAPLGSYLMDTYFPDSDVDVLAIGSQPPKSFFDFAVAQLKALSSDDENVENDGIKGIHFVNSLVPIIEAVFMGIKFDIQYCQAPELLGKYHKAGSPVDLSTLVFDPAVVSALSPSSLRPLNTYRDTAYLPRSIPSHILPAYRFSHRYLSLYLKSRGLYSAKYGYLGGIHLSLLLNRVVKLIITSLPNKDISPATIIRTFFKYYSTFDWAEEAVTDPLLPGHGKDIRRDAREAVVIQAIHSPTARPNVASSCTKLSAQTFTSEFNLAAEQLNKGDWGWCLRPKELVVQEFLGNWGAFVRITLDIWDVDELPDGQTRDIVGALESKMTRLLVGLGRLPGMEGRVWPARFYVPPTKTGEKMKSDNQYKGYYLVGISAKKDEIDTERNKILSSKVMTTVREFERTVQESREFSAGSCFVEMSVVTKKIVMEMGLVLDSRDWSSHEHQVRPPSAQPEITTADEQEAPKYLIPTALPSSHRRGSSNSLRPAQDIISRIKWDPTLNPADFLIGYEDRFIGVKETQLENWKSEQTDEEFIPMHRIVWVRRKAEEGSGGEGEKVWDRRKKVDLIFGSGVGRGVVSS